MTPPSESFPYDEDRRYKCRNKSPSHKGLGNDAISKALNQISKSPFTHRIEGGKLPRRFTQPAFIMYNGRMDHVEHVNHFLLSMTMRERETLKTYSDRYWEMFNEIDGNFDDVAIRTFKVGLPAKHDLRKSLTKKPIRIVHQLMNRINKYKQVEEDQQQRKGKAKVVPQDRRDFRSDRYNSNRPRRDFARQFGSTATQVVSTVFQEPVH